MAPSCWTWSGPRFPRTVRIILSGQSDRETILRSVGPSHQYLSKPCDVDELKQKLMRAFALRDMLDNCLFEGSHRPLENRAQPSRGLLRDD